MFHLNAHDLRAFRVSDDSSSRIPLPRAEARAILNATTRTKVLGYCKEMCRVPESRIPHLASRIPGLESRIPHLESRISNPASRISNLASRIPHIESRIPHPVSRNPHLVSRNPHLGVTLHLPTPSTARTLSHTPFPPGPIPV